MELKKTLQLQQGVTLIEMLVVIAIFGIIASILLFNYGDFNNNISVRTLSQEMGLAVRKAQTYATSVRKDTAAGLQDGPTVYGIAFSVRPPATDGTASAGPHNKQFVLFRDSAIEGTLLTNGSYDISAEGCGSETSECKEVFSITSNDSIEKICYSDTQTTTAERCFDKDTAYSQVTILFRRPSPDALFCFVSAPSATSSSCDTSIKGISSVRIELSSLKGIKKSVLIWNTGQISVQ